MPSETPFKAGDVVVHPRRREWGEGVVETVQRIVHKGRPARRVVVSFRHHGRVAINTGVAPLVAKESGSDMNKSGNHGSPPSGHGGWIGSLEAEHRPPPFWALPEALTDPFDSLPKRLAATLDTYRFSKEPRNLIDWAIAQTGDADPLAQHTRQELEQHFEGFARSRDGHLRDLVRQIKRQDGHEALKQVLARTTNPQARSALERAMRS